MRHMELSVIPPRLFLLVYWTWTDTFPLFRPAEQFIPPVQEPYAYIIFRASEVKDLAVDEPQPRRSVHDDPAVIGVSILTHYFMCYVLQSWKMKLFDGCGRV